jgi:protein-S-isoprenylcysteine O-methyltransferase Ste14
MRRGIVTLLHVLAVLAWELAQLWSAHSWLYLVLGVLLVLVLLAAFLIEYELGSRWQIKSQ